MQNLWLSVLPLLLLAVLHTRVDAAKPVKPPALNPGDTIGFVAPARSMSQEDVDWVTERMTAQGYRVKFAPNVTAQYRYLAGTDEERAAGVMNAFKDPDVDAIFCVNGGYGAMRMLDLLDYKAIRKHPKIVLGFSDITGLHLALQKKAGLVSFHGPMTRFAWIDDEKARPVAASELWRIIDEKRQAEWAKTGYLYTADTETTPVRTITPGVARGRLIGGNLSLVAATMGTPYEIDTKGKILFLEDVHEEPYRIDRMICTLELAGKLDGVKGVILGYYSDAGAKNEKTTFTIEEVLRHYFEHKGYPVIIDFPVGHEKDNTTLPEGIMAELDATKRQVRLLEKPTR